jgi:hypothetical protein
MDFLESFQTLSKENKFVDILRQTLYTFYILCCPFGTKNHILQK